MDSNLKSVNLKDSLMKYSTIIEINYWNMSLKLQVSRIVNFRL